MRWEGDGAAFRVALAVAAGLVVLRSLAFLVFDGLNFNADEALYGIMAHHLWTGRAFPLYTYGQGYILAVSILPAAPVIALLGTTVLALRLPMLGYNLLVVVLLVVGLVREARLSPRAALVATIPFALAAPGPAAHLTMHVGANVEPFVWILLLWVLRRRPIPLGLVAGFGFLNREFTAYGLVALLVVALLEGQQREGGWWRRSLVAAGVFGLVLAAVAALKPYSAYASNFAPSVEFGAWEALQERAANLSFVFLPVLAGAPRSGPALSLNAPTLLGHTLAPVLLLGVCLVALAGVLGRGAGLDRRRSLFPIFLIVVGALSLVSYVLVGRGSASLVYVRYVLLALLLPVGLSALAFTGRIRWARRSVVAGLVLWGTLSLVSHGRLLRDCLDSPPPDQFGELVAFLEGRGFVTGLTDYWTAYPIDYLSGERLKIAGAAKPRILEYRALHNARLDRGVGIVPREPCAGGTPVARWCVVGPPGPSRMREARERAAGEPTPLP